MGGGAHHLLLNHTEKVRVYRRGVHDGAHMNDHRVVTRARVCVCVPPSLAAAALNGFRAASRAIDKYVFLRRLQTEDAGSFYRLLVNNSMEVMPYVYTPTVGEVGGAMNA